MQPNYLLLSSKTVWLFAPKLPSRPETLCRDDFQSRANDASAMHSAYRFLQSTQCHRSRGIIAHILAVEVLLNNIKIEEKKKTSME